ncbi:MAG: hypothetical protein A3H76_01735 [Candidatus Lloydbacteria bacterium RIFCSPLOWO2_02_FULL_54_12]|nr:MAG: hypothetical protein A3H76_01735 [Candidatus Lloydbacteria bacterium RIFCSPLOWO2_02_FULL_54_12]
MCYCVCDISIAIYPFTGDPLNAIPETGDREMSAHQASSFYIREVTTVKFEVTGFMRELLRIVYNSPEISDTWDHVQASDIVDTGPPGRMQRLARVSFRQGPERKSVVKFFFLAGRIYPQGTNLPVTWKLVGYTGVREDRAFPRDGDTDVTWIE